MKHVIVVRWTNTNPPNEAVGEVFDVAVCYGYSVRIGIGEDIDGQLNSFGTLSRRNSVQKHTSG